MNGNYPDGTPQYTQTTSLSPSQQNLFNMGQLGAQALGQTGLQTLGAVNQTYANGFNPGNFGANVGQAQNAAYKAQTQFLDPQFAQAHEHLDNSLINQGVTQGSDAYKNAQTNLGNQQQQAYQGAQYAAVNAGNQEQGQLYGQAVNQYQMPLNIYNGLMTGSQVATPNFSNVPQAGVGQTDVGGITNSAYQNQMSRYNASQAGMNNLFSLGGSLGAAAIMA